jgi:MOSC domain-containing protein YiiM
MGMLKIRILSVNVATPQPLAAENGETILSAIDKKPIAVPRISVGEINIQGDDQANRAVHGGPDKAVYAYPSEHWMWWEKEHGIACRPGGFGENLTLQGADETMVAIGDRFQWGDAVLEIAQPRVPCNKFVLHMGREDAGALMTRSARSGWYLRVLKTGAAPAGDGWLERIKESGGPTVREAFLAVFDKKTTAARRREIHGVQGLSEAWRKRLTDAGL